MAEGGKKAYTVFRTTLPRFTAVLGKDPTFTIVTDFLLADDLITEQQLASVKSKSDQLRGSEVAHCLLEKIKNDDDPSKCLLCICDIFKAEEVNNDQLKKCGTSMKSKIRGESLTLEVSTSQLTHSQTGQPILSYGINIENSVASKFRSVSDRLASTISPCLTGVASKLHAKDLISLELKDEMINSQDIPSMKAYKLVTELQRALNNHPNPEMHLNEVCTALKDIERPITEIVGNLLDEKKLAKGQNFNSNEESGDAKCKETYDTYDSTCDPDATNEEHATNIFKFRDKQLKHLNRPHDVARLLQAEKIFDEEVVKEILNDVLKSESRLQLLLIKIELAISKDHKKLQTFARICLNTGNEKLGNNILKDCIAAFEQSEANFDHLCEVIGSCIEDIEKRINDDAYLSKLISVLRRHYCITLSSRNDCMALVKRETTLFSTTLLEEIVLEFKCRIAKKKIEKVKDTVRKEDVCKISSGELSCHATVETLCIAMTCNDKSYAEIELILSTLFGSLFNDVIRWHGIDNEGIICYFPVVYATLLIEKVIKRFSFCKKKLIKKITIGYCSLYDDTFCDEAYQELKERVDELEKKNLDLEKMNQELSRINEELIKKIDDLGEDNKGLKEKAILLEKKLKDKEEHIKELQDSESHLKEELQARDKVRRKTVLENDYLRSMLLKTKNLEKESDAKQKEVEILKDKISLFSYELEQNTTCMEKTIISLQKENQDLANKLQEKTALSETALRQLFEAKAEVGILQEKLSIETEKNDTVSGTINESTVMMQEQMHGPQAENISMHGSEIILTAPSLTTCKEIKIQQAVLSISLHDAFADSASAILLRLQLTSVSYLYINKTSLSHDSVHSIITLLNKLKCLHLTNVYLPSTSLSYILNALMTNESLEKFIIRFNSQMLLPLSSTSAASYAQSISDVIKKNTTLLYFSVIGLGLDEDGVLKILHVLANENVTLQLLSLDKFHESTAYKFSEANGPIKNKLGFL